jgi:hypothetical protein
VAIAKNTNKDVVIQYTTGIIGINYNGKALTNKDFNAENGRLTIKKEFLSTLSSGSHELTIYCTNSFHTLYVDVNSYSLNIDGEFNYTLDGNDKVYTVETDGFDLSQATVSDSKKQLTASDYSVEGNTLRLKAEYLNSIVQVEEITIKFSEDASLSFKVYSKKLLFVDFDNYNINKGFALGMTTESVSGQSGNGMKLSNTATATMLAVGGAFYSLDFQPGTYVFSFDLKIENVNTNNNLVISGNSCYMPITFGSGKDVTYLRVTKTGNEYTVLNETQQLGVNSYVGKPDVNGFIHVEFTFVVVDSSTQTLTFDVWMPSTIVIDNLLLVKQ